MGMEIDFYERLTGLYVAGVYIKARVGAASNT